AAVWPSSDTATSRGSADTSSSGDGSADARGRMQMGGSTDTRGSGYGAGYGDSRYRRSQYYYPPAAPAPPVAPAPPEGMQNQPQGYGYPPYRGNEPRQRYRSGWGW
ncbi:MAG: hypothetical protein OQL16_12100, partial [Gammaproteobacteria bacterium]|nr:hypothetical protein [Gammaproteobacteria bacterium]